LQDLNTVDHRMWGNIARKGVQARITNLDLSTTPMTNGCRNDDDMQL